MDGHELRRAPAIRIVAYQVSLDTRVARMKTITLGGKKSQLVQRTNRDVESCMQSLSECSFYAACWLFNIL